MSNDLVERLRRDAKAAQWTTEPPESAPAIDPEDALAAADRIEALEREKADLAIGYEEYKRLYEAGCKAWNPVFKKTLDRVGALEKERDSYRATANQLAARCAADETRIEELEDLLADLANAVAMDVDVMPFVEAAARKAREYLHTGRRQ